MTQYLFLISGFIFGVILASVFNFFKNKNNNDFLLDFKKSIDEIKTQNQIHSAEIKSALDSTTTLTKIFTTNQNLKGQFGEECLENILKNSFSLSNVDYFKQYITKNSDNNSIKPDYVVKLPNNKAIVIDCKLNLEKFIEYKNSIKTQFEASKKSELKQDLNNTINSLSSKKYNSINELNQPDFILMYIPLEPLITLIYTDEDFYSVIKNADEKNIIIVGNSSILTTIRLVREIWSNEIQNNNIDEIIDIAQKIYDEIAKHSKNLSQIKAKIDDLNTDFNKEYQKISQDNAVFKLANKMRDFGIKSYKSRNGRKISEIEISDELLN